MGFTQSMSKEELTKNTCLAWDRTKENFLLFFIPFSLFLYLCVSRRSSQINIPILIAFLAVHVQEDLQLQFFLLQFLNLQQVNIFQ